MHDIDMRALKAIEYAKKRSIAVAQEVDASRLAVCLDGLASMATDLVGELARARGVAPWSTAVITSELRWVWVAMFVNGRLKTVTQLFFGCAPAFVAGLVIAADAIEPGMDIAVFVLPDDFQRMRLVAHPADLERVLATVRADCDAEDATVKVAGVQ